MVLFNPLQLKFHVGILESFQNQQDLYGKQSIQQFNKHGNLLDQILEAFHLSLASHSNVLQYLNSFGQQKNNSIDQPHPHQCLLHAIASTIFSMATTP